jgi:hypothetical protein
VEQLAERYHAARAPDAGRRCASSIRACGSRRRPMPPAAAPGSTCGPASRRRWRSRPAPRTSSPPAWRLHLADPGYAAVLLPRSGLGQQARHRARQSGSN